jgi:hypothetical protein
MQVAGGNHALATEEGTGDHRLWQGAAGDDRRCGFRTWLAADDHPPAEEIEPLATQGFEIDAHAGRAGPISPARADNIAGGEQEELDIGARHHARDMDALAAGIDFLWEVGRNEGWEVNILDLHIGGPGGEPGAGILSGADDLAAGQGRHGEIHCTAGGGGVELGAVDGDDDVRARDEPIQIDRGIAPGQALVHGGDESGSHYRSSFRECDGGCDE